MKKLLIFLVLAGALASCKKDKPETSTVDLQIQVSYPPNESNYTLPLEGIKVTLTNLMTGRVIQQQTDVSGTLLFKGISAGNYDIDANITIPAGTYSQITGTDPGGEITFNASSKNSNIFAGFADPISLQLVSGKLGGLVIKQVYYAGSNAVNGALFRDQFIEIYNNTNDVIYADSLYFGRLWGKQTATSTSSHYQENGQLDWSKSEGMNAGDKDPNKDFVYLRELIMIPGDGHQYPIQPGNSIIIAQNAMNHKVPFTDGNGNEVPIKDPTLTVDLSGADFEGYYGDLPGVSPYPSDIDNPNVPNVEVLLPSGRDLLLDNPGRDSYVIFKSNGIDVKLLPAYFEPKITPPSVTDDKFIQLPVALIDDAVEIQPNIAKNRIPKKLLPAFDAGFAFVTDGAYSSHAVIRKTSGTENGRKVLKDTNNSTEDFVDIKASPRGFAQ